MKYGSLIVLLLVAGASILFISMDTKKPKLKGTTWKCVESMFVADAGNERITYTLEFTSDRDVVYKRESYMPPFPSMRMNADGTVSTEPGWSSESSDKGTYKFKRKTLTITFENGSTDIFEWKDGKLVSLRRSISGELREFSLAEGE